MKVIDLMKALNKYDGDKEIHFNGNEFETVNLVFDTSNEKLSLYPNGLPKENKYELKEFPREIANNITNGPYDLFQDSISYSTDYFGNLVLVVNLNHEEHTIIEKDKVLKEIEKGIDKWGWLSMEGDE